MYTRCDQRKYNESFKVLNFSSFLSVMNSLKNSRRVSLKMSTSGTNTTDCFWETWSDIIISHRPLEQTSHVKGQTWVQRCYYITVPRKQLEDDVCDTTNCIEAIGPKTECSCMNSCLLKTFSYLYLSDFFSVILFFALQLV